MFAVTKKEREETQMAVNARTEKFQHLEVFDKPALFTNGRIARDTVPKGWYCYDIRGSDDDPGELCYMEENVVVNHAGSVLMPEKLAMPMSASAALFSQKLPHSVQRKRLPVLMPPTM